MQQDKLYWLVFTYHSLPDQPFQSLIRASSHCPLIPVIPSPRPQRLHHAVVLQPAQVSSASALRIVCRQNAVRMRYHVLSALIAFAIICPFHLLPRYRLVIDSSEFFICPSNSCPPHLLNLLDFSLHFGELPAFLFQCSFLAC